MGEMTQFGSLFAVVMFLWPMILKWFPRDFLVLVNKYVHKVISYVYPYIEITFHEYEAEGWFVGSKAYKSIERYLSTNSASRAKRLKANAVKDCESVVLSMDEYEEVIDEFNGIKVWWTSSQKIPQQRALFSYRADEEKRFYQLTCKSKHRDIVTKVYLQHVLDEGKAIAVKTRQRKLYTNNKADDRYSYRRSTWSHIAFEHPSTFDTLAMDPKRKKEILDDLVTFSKSNDYYTRRSGRHGSEDIFFTALQEPESLA